MDKFKLSIILALTLGLAPFYPEPHIWGKINWIIGGGEGMAFADYFDILLHGAPWAYFLFQLGLKLKGSKPE